MKALDETCENSATEVRGGGLPFCWMCVYASDLNFLGMSASDHTSYSLGMLQTALYSLSGRPTNLPSFSPAFLLTCLPSHLPSFSPAFLLTCLPSHLPSFSPALLLTCFPTHLLSYLPAFLLICLPTYLPSFSPAFLLTYLPTHLPSYSPTFLLTYLPSHLPSFSPAFLLTFLICLPPHLPCTKQWTLWGLSCPWVCLIGLPTWCQVIKLVLRI
jgi:hypothetical protein